jgi:hypothetical protein
MRSLRALWLGMATGLASTSLAAQAAAATRSGSQEPFVVLATDGTGKPMAGAQAFLTLEPLARLPALDEAPRFGLPPLERPRQAAGSFAQGTASAQGVLRVIPPRDELPLRATGVVMTTTGLGAAVGWLLPNQPQRVVLEPLAAVTMASGASFALHARLVTPDGRTKPLRLTADAAPEWRAEFRLPAGDYELWGESAAGWQWQRAALRSGERLQLPPLGATVRLQQAHGASLHLLGCPDLDLFAAGSEARLGGVARLATWTGWSDGWRVPTQPLPQPGPNAVVWPTSAPPARERLAVPGTFAPDARPDLYLVAPASQGGMVLAHARWQPDDDGICALPSAGPEDAWLLWVEPGRAPLALRWAERAELAAAVRSHEPSGVLAAKVTDPTGLPVGNLAVQYTPDGQAPALVLAHSDARGRLQFGPVRAPGRLCVVDPRFRNQDLALAQVPEAPVVLAVDPGAVLHGRVRWPDGSPGAGAVVTLRDPSGQLQPPQRSTTVAADGTFAFAGLEDQQRYVLVASLPRAGHTFAARLGVVVARDAGYALELRDEDPRLEGPAGDR